MNTLKNAIKALRERNIGVIKVEVTKTLTLSPQKPDITTYTLFLEGGKREKAFIDEGSAIIYFENGMENIYI